MLFLYRFRGLKQLSSVTQDALGSEEGTIRVDRPWYVVHPVFIYILPTYSPSSPLYLPTHFAISLHCSLCLTCSSQCVERARKHTVPKSWNRGRKRACLGVYLILLLNLRVHYSTATASIPPPHRSPAHLSTGRRTGLEQRCEFSSPLHRGVVVGLALWPR